MIETPEAQSPQAMMVRRGIGALLYPHFARYNQGRGIGNPTAIARAIMAQRLGSPTLGR